MTIFSREKKAGFTIIELMVVIVIVGIFSSVAVPQVGGWINEFRMDQTVNAIFTEMKSIRVEAAALERCGRTRVDIENNTAYFEIAKAGANDGFDCGTGDLDEVEDWETSRPPIVLPDGVIMTSAGSVNTGDASYISFTKHGGSGVNNMGGNHNGIHFITVNADQGDECAYKTISFENPTGLVLDFIVYDGNFTLENTPDCADW